MAGRVDPAGLYRSTHARVVEVLEGGDWTTPVPACPGWRVHDLVGHLLGLAEAVAALELEGFGSHSWTAEQVGRAAAVPRDELAGRFREIADAVGERLADDSGQLPLPIAFATVGDLTVHEHDLRAALDRPGARDSDAVEFSYRLQVRRLDKQLRRRHAPALRLAPTDAPPQVAGEGPEAGVVVAPRFELWRTMMGRRSRAQAAAFDWTPGPEEWIEDVVFRAATDGTSSIDWAATDLSE